MDGEGTKPWENNLAESSSCWRCVFHHVLNVRSRQHIKWWGKLASLVCCCDWLWSKSYFYDRPSMSSGAESAGNLNRHVLFHETLDIEATTTTTDGEATLTTEVCSRSTVEVCSNSHSDDVKSLTTRYDEVLCFIWGKHVYVHQCLKWCLKCPPCCWWNSHKAIDSWGFSMLNNRNSFNLLFGIIFLEWGGVSPTRVFAYQMY